MKIKKIGHCCLLINLDGLTILTDPGVFSKEQNSIMGIDVVLITHEHADHLHTQSLQKIIENNPSVKIFTNSGVGEKLTYLGIEHNILEGRQSKQIEGVLVEAFDHKHEEIFEEMGQVQNTGYFIGEKLFYPGDAFCDPKKPIDILALPVAGPWCKVPDAIRYTLKVKPNKAFPVHDGMLQQDKIGASHKVPEMVLAQNGIQFITLNSGDEIEF